MYTLPGMVPGMLLRNAAAILIPYLFERTLAPAASPTPSVVTPTDQGRPESHHVAVSVSRLGLYMLGNALCTCATVPLDCVLTRLAVQMPTEERERARTPGSPAPGTVSGPCAPESGPETSAAEPVWTLRPSHASLGTPTLPPYNGLLDCARAMLTEEGPASLCRGAALTCLVLLVVHSAAAAPVL